MAAIKRLSVLDPNAGYIFISFGIIEAIRVTLEIEYHFSHCQGVSRERGRTAASQTTILRMKRFNEIALRFSLFCVF